MSVVGIGGGGGGSVLQAILCGLKVRQVMYVVQEVAQNI